MIFYQIIYLKPLGIGPYHQIFNFVFPQFKMKVQKLHLKPETIWVRMFLRSARYYSVNRQVGAESILKLHLNSTGLQFHKILIFWYELFNKAQYNVQERYATQFTYEVVEFLLTKVTALFLASRNREVYFLWRNFYWMLLTWQRTTFIIDDSHNLQLWTSYLITI